MTIKIKVKNATNKPITLTADDQSTVPIAAGKEAEVPIELVRSAEFGDHLANARIVLPRTALEGVPANERPTAAQVVGDIVLRIAPRFLAHHGELVTSLANLGALRDRYNELYGATIQLITSAKTLAPGAEAVIQATDLLSAAEEDVVEAADKALRDHLEDLPKKPDDLAKWYVAHRQLEANRDAAISARNATRTAVAQQLEATRSELGVAAAAFIKADPKKDVGGPVTWG